MAGEEPFQVQEEMKLPQCQSRQQMGGSGKSIYTHPNDAVKCVAKQKSSGTLHPEPVVVFLPQLVHWFTINNSWLFGTGPWILIGGHNITKYRAQDLPGWNCLHVFFSFGKSLCFYQIISTMCIVDMWGQSGYAISHNHPSWIRSVFVLIMPCRHVIQVFISLSSHCPFPIKFPRCKFFTCILMVWSQLLYRTFPTGWGCFYGAPM